jgi:DNA-binding MarR family transcriptional regulator
MALDQTEGLGPRHLKVLAQLALHGPQSVSELSARLGLTVPTTSLMAGELSNAGLVERSEDPADRRRTIVSMSHALVPELDQLVESRIGLVSQVLAELEPDERDAFLKGLRSLIAQIETLS